MAIASDRPGLTYITQQFEDAVGVQYKQTPLTSSPQQFNSLQNMRFNQGYSLEGINGIQPFGQAMRFNKILNYSYLDSTTASTKNELLGMNRGLWKATDFDLVFTKVSVGTANWVPRVRLNTSTGFYQFQFVVNGVTVFSKDLTPPMVGIGAYTVHDFIAEFNASVAGYTVVISNVDAFFYGQFSGNQTVAPGVGNVVTFNVTNKTELNQPVSVAFYDIQGGSYVDLPFWNSTLGTISVISPLTLSVNNNMWFGIGSIPLSAAMKIEDAPATTTNPKTITCVQWRRVLSSLDSLWPLSSSYEEPFISWQTNQAVTNINEAVQATNVNAQQGCYILAPAFGQGNNEGNAFAFEGYPWRYDGRFICRAGLPQTTINSIVKGGVGTTSNVVKFIVVPKLRDYRGVVIRGPASAPFTFNLWSTPTTANYQITINTIQRTTGFYTVGAKVNGAGQAVPGTVNVVRGHQLRAGDVIRASVVGFTGSVANTYTVTGATPTTITLSGPAGTLVNNQWIGPLSWEVYVTNTNGVDYYLTAEMPNQADATTQVLEADYALPLGTAYDEPDLTYEPYPPPRALTMAIHDGAIVLGGSPSQPNSIFWSRPGASPSSNLESFPPLNTAIVPSSVEGSITALISDSGDRLVVGKASGHYEVVGNIHNRNISIDIVREGDWGFSSQGSTLKVNGVIYGICRLGIYTIQNGQIINGIVEDINPILLRNPNLNYSRAIAFNNRVNNTLRVYVPVLPAVGTREPTTGAVDLAMDYINQNAWFNRLFPLGMQMSADMVNYRNEVYHCSGGIINGIALALPGVVYRQLSLVTDYAQNFAFYNQPITYVMESSFLHDGRPSFDKLFLQIKFWQMYLPYETSFVACDYTLEIFRDFNSTTPYATTTFSTTSSSEFEKIVDLFEECKARAVRWRLTANTVLQSPRVSGWELLMKAPYVDANFLK